MKTETQKKIEMRKASKGEIELRTQSTKIEMRAAEDGSTTSPIISGYAAVYDEPSTGLWFIEIIERGAFDETDFSGCKAVFNHDDNIILGSVSGGTLQLELDERGLKYTITPPDTQYVRDMVIEPMRRGDLDKSSFRFSLDHDDESVDSWDWDYVNAVAVRKISKIARVLDVSPVLFPAYDAAESTVRKASECLELKEKAEEAKQQEEAKVNTGTYLFV